jgi:hypothetical protein
MSIARVNHSNEYVQTRWAEYRVVEEVWEAIAENMLLADTPVHYRVKPTVEEPNEMPPHVLYVQAYSATGNEAAELPYPFYVRLLSTKEKKWSVTGDYEKGPLREDCRPWVKRGNGLSDHMGAAVINVGKSKRPQLIAKDILRRFMPGHKDISYYVRRKVAELTESHRQQDQLADTVKAMVNYRHKLDGSTDRQVMNIDLKDANPEMIKPDGYGNSVEVSYRHISIKLSDLTVKGLEAILTVLRKERDNE